jgi:carbon monoxide dehydrogenase subunit G
MPSAERTVTIDRPVDEVFTFVSDGRNAKLWRPGVLDVDLVSGSGLGARYSQGVRGPGGRRIAADYEITEFEPNSKIAIRATAGPIRPTGSFTFEGMGPGTILTFKLDAELGGLQRLLIGGIVQSTMDAEMGALDGLKELLER